MWGYNTAHSMDLGSYVGSSMANIHGLLQDPCPLGWAQHGPPRAGPPRTRFGALCALESCQYFCLRPALARPQECFRNLGGGYGTWAPREITKNDQRLFVQRVQLECHYGIRANWTLWVPNDSRIAEISSGTAVGARDSPTKR